MHWWSRGNSEEASNSSSASGSGTASNSVPGTSSTAEPSNSSGKKPEGRVITDSDFESESEKSWGGYSSDSDPNESEVSKLIYSSDFNARVSRLSKPELQDVISTIDFMKESYRQSKVPSANEQIKSLIQKEEICFKALDDKLREENNHQKNDDKGKGKEKENNSKDNDKGK